MHHAHKPDLYLPSSRLPFLPSFPHLSSPSSSSSISLLYTLLFSPFSLTCSSPSPLSSVLPPPTSPLLSVSFPSLPPPPSPPHRSETWWCDVWGLQVLSSGCSWCSVEVCWPCWYQSLFYLLPYGDTSSLETCESVRDQERERERVRIPYTCTTVYHEY